MTPSTPAHETHRPTAPPPAPQCPPPAVAPGAPLWMVVAGLLGAVGVAASAWSAHGLAALVAAADLPLALSRAQTATQFALLHALALLGLSVAQRQVPSGWLTAAGCLWTLGVLGFSGGLLGLRVVAGIHSGPTVSIVPLGGLCLIAGWLALAVAGWRRR